MKTQQAKKIKKKKKDGIYQIHLYAYLVCGLQTNCIRLLDFRILNALPLLLHFSM